MKPMISEPRPVFYLDISRAEFHLVLSSQKVVLRYSRLKVCQHHISSLSNISSDKVRQHKVNSVLNLFFINFKHNICYNLDFVKLLDHF